MAIKLMGQVLHSNSRTTEVVRREIRLCKESIPAFTLYHYAGYNSIGKVELDLNATNSFFRERGTLVCDSKIVPSTQETVLFSPLSLSNTLFNDGFRLANKKEKTLWI